MLDRCDIPPAPAEESAYPIVRTPAQKPLTGIITTDRLVGIFTHYAKTRTVPCERREDCPWCEKGYSRRWHGYVGLIITPGVRHVIFEMTATAAHQLDAYIQVYSTLRACELTAQRHNKRANGRISLSTKHTDEARYNVPQPIDVWTLLCHIWNVSSSSTELVDGRGAAMKEIRVGTNPDDGRHRPTNGRKHRKK